MEKPIMDDLAKLSRCLVIVGCAVLSSCRIGVAVFDGGDVLSLSETRHCFEGGTCEFKVEDATFSERFIAQPRSGYVFKNWKEGEGFLCSGSTDPVCDVDLSGGELAEAIVGSDNMMYLMPEFECVGHCPPRPDPNWRALDEALVEMEKARLLVEAYVAENDVYANPANLYGINLGTRMSDMLKGITVYTTNGGLPGSSVYLTAHIYESVWTGGIPDSYVTSGFSLSGSTNDDGTMRWDCIPLVKISPSGSNVNSTIPEPYLPLNCRG